jgi:cryptochrome
LFRYVAVPLYTSWADHSASASISGPDHDFAVPTLSSLGLGEATTTIHGGETEALRRLTAFLADKSRTATFSKPASAPTSLEPSTTQLSPYLKFGCLSVRDFYWRAKEVIDSYVPKKGETVTKEPENLLGQVSACRGLRDSTDPV